MGVDETHLLGIVTNERHIRLYTFLLVFILMAFWEFLASRRREKVRRLKRWPHNLILTILNTFIIRILFPSALIGVAYWAGNLGFGLFNWVEVPIEFSIIFTVVAMDWVVYYQHRIFHSVPLLWKFHRMHHTDLEMDVTTGTRFHIGEMILSMLIKSFFVLLLGAHPFGVFLYEVISNASLLFNHSNVRMPRWLDKILRLLIVTPDMHRVHHSVIPAETNSNFGFILSIWDRLLFTYRAQPKQGHDKMKIGLDIFDNEKDLTLNRLLIQPFLDEKGRFAWSNLLQK